MSKMQVAKAILVKKAGRGGLVLRKHSPEILLVAGVAGIVTSTVLACRATLKLDDVVNTAEANIDRVKGAKENFNEQTYSNKDYQRDLTLVYFQSGAKIARLYALPLTLGVLSIGCIVGSHGIMHKRNLAMVAAYKMVESGFAEYRNRVVEELGADKDRQYRYGLVEEKVKVEETDENGKTKKVTKTVEVVDNSKRSQYARFFDEGSTQWSKTPEYSLIYLKAQQNYANDLLQSRGHVFLNEVYDMIGVPRTQAGAVVGWVLSKDGSTDNFVDFGIFDINSTAARNFVNGYERSILLDFNVDGIIYDKI